MRPKRFFYHYRRCDKIMSVHFEGVCYPVQHVRCQVPCETKFNNRQPYLVMRGFARKVELVGPLLDLTAVIS